MCSYTCKQGCMHIESTAIILFIVCLMHTVNGQDQHTARQSTTCSPMPVNVISMQSLSGWGNVNCCNSLEWADPQSCWAIVFFLPAFIPQVFIVFHVSNILLSPEVLAAIQWILHFCFIFSFLSFCEPIYILACIISILFIYLLSKIEWRRKN